MKKIIAVLAVCAAVFGFASCGKKASAPSEKFVLGLDDSFPPLGFRDENNEITGYDIDLAKEACARMGKTLVCQPIDWSAKEMELKTGKISCIWNGLTITEERLASMALTKPYLANAQVVVVNNGSGIEKLSDLANKVAGVQAGSSAQEAVDAAPEFKSGLKAIVEFKDNVTALNDLETGNISCVVMDLVVAEYEIKTGNKDMKILKESLAPEYYGIAFAKDNVELRDQVQKTLEEMAADGTIAKISEKWFGSDISVVGK